MNDTDTRFLCWLSRVSVQERLNLDLLTIAFREPRLVAVCTDDVHQAKRLWIATIKSPPHLKIQIFLDRQLYVEC